MSLLKIVKIGGLFTLTAQETTALVVGFFVSFIVAMIVINKFISNLKRKPMKIFAQYRMIFAIFVLLAGVAGLFE